MKKHSTEPKKLNLRGERIRVLLATELTVAGARRACSDMDTEHTMVSPNPASACG